MKKKLYLRIAAAASMVLVVASFVAYSFYDLGYYAYCAYNYKYFYIYADAFGGGTDTVSCANSIRETSGDLSVALMILALGIVFFLIMFNEAGKKLFVKFLKFYIPTALIIYVYGVVSSFCIMMGCNDGVTPALQFDGLLFLVFTFTIAWRVLMPEGKEKYAFLFLLIIPVAMYYGGNKLDQIERIPVQAHINAVEALKADSCPRISTELFQSCLEQVAIGLRNQDICSRIVDAQHKLFCTNAVSEQITIDTLDVTGCSKIQGNQSWLDNCNARMKDKINPPSL